MADSLTERSGAVVPGHQGNADGKQQTERGIDEGIERGESAAAHALEKPDVLELAYRSRQQTGSERKREPRKHGFRHAHGHDVRGGSYEAGKQEQDHADGD